MKSFLFFFGGDPSWGWETPAKFETRKAVRVPAPNPAAASSCGGRPLHIRFHRTENQAAAKVTNEGKEIMSGEALTKLP